MGNDADRLPRTRGRARWFAGSPALVNTVVTPFRAWQDLAAVRRWMGAQLRREQDSRRLFLWLPVALGAGVLFYFAADREPSLAAPLFGAILSMALALLARDRRGAAFMSAVAASAIFTGFAAAAIRTTLVASPVLDRLRIARVTGYVETIEHRVSGARLIVRPATMQGTASGQLPFRIRVSANQRPSMQAGDFVAFVARLAPPAESSRPGGYDFAREAFFMRLGAVGSVSGAISLAPAPGEPSWDISMAAAVDRARNALTARIASVVGGPAGAVSAALITGKRGLIDERTNDDLRAAGIYHVVSISGLHMILAAGMVFWLVRAALALLPDFASAWPFKKLAAVAAMVAGAAYNVFAGSEIATERSLVMTLVLLGAILADRPALSMRNLAIAAILVLLFEPESLLGPSFQMSFAAVAALIAVYEREGASGAAAEVGGLVALGGQGELRPARPPPTSVERVARFIWAHVWGAMLTTLVAEAATAPFALYHFQRFTPYGVVGNVLTLPLMSVLVMPAALVGVIAVPFGLDAPVWRVMGMGVQWMLDVSAMVARWDGVVRNVHAFGPAVLLLLSAATLWATLWRSWIRLASAPLAVAALAIGSVADGPDLMIAPDGRSLAARAADGRLAILGRAAGSFAIEQWLRADADPRSPTDPSLFRSARCDGYGCVLGLAGGRMLAHVTTPAAFEEDCGRAAILVTPLAAPAWCQPPLLVDRVALTRSGALAISFGHAIPAIHSAARTKELSVPGPSEHWSRQRGRLRLSRIAEMKEQRLLLTASLLSKTIRPTSIRLSKRATTDCADQTSRGASERAKS